jgi:hypothetical protein
MSKASPSPSPSPAKKFQLEQSEELLHLKIIPAETTSIASPEENSQR